MESHLCKVFVGNVPFQCNQVEFQNCFDKLTGFIKAEIVCKPGTNISRGFGFVTFDSPETAKYLIGNESMIFKDRNLRFTEYVSSDNNKNSNFNNDNVNNSKQLISLGLKNKNFIIVKGLKQCTTREELYNIFSQFSEIGRYFIVSDQETGTIKSYAVVEILSDSAYELLLEQKELKLNNFYVLELSRWKMTKCYGPSKEKKITKYDLFKAFTAGRNVGMIEATKHNKILC
jgi:RNA recognition motif-containing protein